MSHLIGRKAPVFHASAVVDGGTIVEEFSLEQYHGKKYVIFFFYPKDFTFVCPTELHAFQEMLSEFESRNVQVVACSTDSAESHWGWLQVPKAKGGIQGVKYPLVADINKTIADAFGVLAGQYQYNEEGFLSAGTELVAYRGLFLLDKDGVVHHATVNNFSIGRNVEEALRVVDALQYTEEHGEVCPANWVSGRDAMKADHTGVADYLAEH